MNENNPIIRHVFTSDPTVLEYQETVYLYTGHDETPEGSNVYNMNYWLCFSSQDLQTWIQHSSPFAARNYSWASGDAFASKIVYHNQKFYLFTAVSHRIIAGKAIGVAVSHSPTGPFRDAIGAALITGHMLPVKTQEKTNLDPTIIVDDDGRAYIFWGNGMCFYARLKEDLLGIDGEIKQVDLPSFSEGSHIYRRSGKYYLMYGYGFPERVAYAVSNSIHGPWKFMNIITEVAGNCETIRPATLDFQEKSYFFYHNGALANGGSLRRSVCIDYMHYNEDGSVQKIIMTSEGIHPARQPRVN